MALLAHGTPPLRVLPHATSAFSSLAIGSREPTWRNVFSILKWPPSMFAGAGNWEAPGCIDRFRLRDYVEERIQEHRVGERKAAYQRFLFEDSALTVSDEYVINFKTVPYEPSWVYEGGFQFKKHYYGPKIGEL